MIDYNKDNLEGWYNILDIKNADTTGSRNLRDTIAISKMGMGDTPNQTITSCYELATLVLISYHNLYYDNEKTSYIKSLPISLEQIYLDFNIKGRNPHLTKYKINKALKGLIDKNIIQLKTLDNKDFNITINEDGKLNNKDDNKKRFYVLQKTSNTINQSTGEVTENTFARLVKPDIATITSKSESNIRTFQCLAIYAVLVSRMNALGDEPSSVLSFEGINSISIRSGGLGDNVVLDCLDLLDKWKVIARIKVMPYNNNQYQWFYSRYEERGFLYNHVENAYNNTDYNQNTKFYNKLIGIGQPFWKKSHPTKDKEDNKKTPSTSPVANDDEDDLNNKDNILSFLEAILKDERTTKDDKKQSIIKAYNLNALTNSDKQKLLDVVEQGII